MANFWVKFENEIERNSFGTKYVEHNGHYYQATVSSGGYSTFRVKDMTDAGKRGAKCLELYIEAKGDEVFRWHFWDMLNNHREEFFSLMQNRASGIGIFENFRVRYDEYLAIRTFPLDLSVLKPLKQTPNKWTLPNVVRALVNGQYQELENTGRYEMDTGHDFSVGMKLNPLKLAQRITENPSGWWTSLDQKGVLSICCHSFDCNEFVPDIENVNPYKLEQTKDILEVVEPTEEIETFVNEAVETQLESELDNNIIEIEPRQGVTFKESKPNLSRLKVGSEISYRGAWYPVKRVFERSVMVSNWQGIPECSQLIEFVAIEKVSAEVRDFG